jgi:hypothetical protein
MRKRVLRYGATTRVSTTREPRHLLEPGNG